MASNLTLENGTLPDSLHVRPATSDDADSIRRFSLDNDMFEPDEMHDLEEMMSGYFDGTLDRHSWIVVEDGDHVVEGAAYFAPEPFADRMWNLYFIAAQPGRQRRGVGRTLITYVEKVLREQGPQVARVLIVETSSLNEYEKARSFYRKQGYDEEARIREFYGPGDDKIVFWKSLTTEP